MRITLDSTLLDVAQVPDVDADTVLRMQEAALGSGLPLNTPLHSLVQHVAFITRPKYILFLNDLIEVPDEQ